MTELIAEVSDTRDAIIIPIRSFPVAQFLTIGLVFLVISFITYQKSIRLQLLIGLQDKQGSNLIMEPENG